MQWPLVEGLYALTLSIRHSQIPLKLATAGCRRRPVRVRVLPLLQYALRLLNERLSQQSALSTPHLVVCCICAYSLLPWLGDVLVRLEEGADVDSLPAPEVSVDGPVEGELQGAAVELAGGVLVLVSRRNGLLRWCCCSQDFILCGHAGVGGGRAPVDVFRLASWYSSHSFALCHARESSCRCNRGACHDVVVLAVIEA